MHGQSKRDSAVEAAVNVAIGYIISVVSQIALFPLFGIDVPLSVTLEMGIWFTAISLARSYLIRRWFETRNGENAYR